MRWFLTGLLVVTGVLIAADITRVVSATASTAPASATAPLQLAALPAQQPDPKPSLPASPCHPGMPAQAIVVSIASQHLWACEHARVVQSTPVTTGAAEKGDATPVGRWHVHAKLRNQWLTGATWDREVHYWMPYDGDTIGFHDATWQRFPKGSAKFATHGSHGCVHLGLRQMRQLFNWVQPGAAVIVRH